jgi:hypothetical protein
MGGNLQAGEIKQQMLGRAHISVSEFLKQKYFMHVGLYQFLINHRAKFETLKTITAQRFTAQHSG